MSRLVGYALPGAVFLLFGAKWSWQVAGRARDSTGGGLGALASAAPSAPPGDDSSEAAAQRVRPRKRRCSSSCPLEGLIKLCVAGVGVVASLVAAYPDGSIEYVGDVLHATIYLFFALSGLADVLAHYCFPGGARAFARVAFSVAFFVEGSLFLLALPEGPNAERRVISLLVVSVWGCAISVALEDLYPALAFVRCLFAIVHGSWFVQSGFLLHWQQKHRTWDTTPLEHEGGPDGHAVWVSLAYAWHLAAALSLILVLLVVRRGCSNTPPAVPEFDGFGAPPRHSHGQNPCPFCDGLGGHHHAPC